MLKTIYVGDSNSRNNEKFVVEIQNTTTEAISENYNKNVESLGLSLDDFFTIEDRPYLTEAQLIALSNFGAELYVTEEEKDYLIFQKLNVKVLASNELIPQIESDRTNKFYITTDLGRDFYIDGNDNLAKGAAKLAMFILTYGIPNIKWDFVEEIPALIGKPQSIVPYYALGFEENN